MMESNIQRALGITNAIFEMVDTRGETATKLAELRRALVRAEEEKTALIEENAALKHTVAEYEQFDIDRERYEHRQLPSGAWVVVVKPSAAGESDAAQAGMYFCQSCFSKRQREVLQPVGKNGSDTYLRCHGCGSEFRKDAPPKGFAEFC